jgi:predicted unusual protein kinase regulating ubiquinone biosynthesis (AarF/ABC1/UbiB family)
MTTRKVLRVAVPAVAVGAGVFLYKSPGAVRSLQFWVAIGPTIVEYQGIKAKGWLDDIDEQQLQRRKAVFHERTAGKAVDIILELGGIYVKLGQLVSTIGVGIFEDSYIDAFAILQDGVPPRSFEEIRRIIEEDVGAPLEELFCQFDSVPVGAASIAQAHRAVLADGSPVIVKVQYPEVALHYKYDFDNLEFAMRWLFPENLQVGE